MLVRSFIATAIAAVLLALTPTSANAAAVAKVVLDQSGATLLPGQAVTFTATAVDKRGNPVPGARLKFKSSNPGVVRVQPDGLATANEVGEATITVSSGKKKAIADVDVVRPLPEPDGPDVTVVKAEINHVLARDGWIYWTESGKKSVRIRKIAKTGGLIYDLTSESAKDDRALRVAYVQMRIAGDRLFFTRQTRGFFQHWSILSVALAGGDRQTHLREDVSIEPLLAGGWNIIGRKLLVALAFPEDLRLPNNTRLAALDLDTGEWSPVVRGIYRLNRLFIVAVDGQFAYLRGTLENDQTQVARLDPAVGTDSLTELFTFNGDDEDASQPGVIDGVNLYFFSEGQGESHRLLSLPLAGGDPTTLDTGPLGFGLTLEDGFLYFAVEGERLVRMPVGGGKVDTLRSDLEPVTTLGGIGIDDDFVYPVSKQGKVFTIHRLSR